MNKRGTIASRSGSPGGAEVFRLLKRFESRHVTAVTPDGTWPIVWKRARGAYVWDTEGRRYTDLTAAFGVAAAGHTNRRVVAAGTRQMRELPHAMGDVHPHAAKALLARELSGLTFERWSELELAGEVEGHGALGLASARRGRPRGKTIFCNSGFEAVEAGLKTALLATGKPGVIAFENSYHGLGYGALAVTHRELFREPFKRQMLEFGHFTKFPAYPKDLAGVEREIRGLARAHACGAILAEPVQGRGGVRVPPEGFLRLLRGLADELGLVLVLDEIYTGFGRTGRWFATEREGVAPDVVCLGKALTGGYPLSACVGRDDLMDRAWPESSGEAIHTSTFLGNPVGCAMALANVEEIRSRGLPERAAEQGRFLMDLLRRLRLPPGISGEVRGLGLMVGLEFRRADGGDVGELVFAVVRAMLAKGFLLLPEGARGEVLAFSPPLMIARASLAKAIAALQECLDAKGGAV